MKKTSLLIVSLLIPFIFSCEKNETGENGLVRTYDYPGGTIKMIYCPGGTFLTNDDDGDTDFEDGPEVKVDPFWISATEVSNELLAWILNCASGLDIVQGAITGGPPIFDTEDINAPNYLCEDYVKWGNQQLIYMGGSQLYGFHDIALNNGFSVSSGLDDLPCTDITWYGAIMACNWLTEEALGLGGSKQVYSGIDEEWWANETLCDLEKTGFRLPSAAEWECAARWQGSKNSGECYEYPAGSGQYWTRGGCASGGTAAASDVAVTSKFAVYKYNDAGIENPDDVQVVKGNRQANALGLYDMSGNVWEWCYNEAGSWTHRIVRGGGAFSNYPDIRIISGWDYSADGTASDLGFRLVMSAEK